MKTQLLQDFNDSRADHAGTPRPGAGAGVRADAPAAPAAAPAMPTAPAGPTELEATVIPAVTAAVPAPAAATPPLTPATKPAQRPRPAVWQRPQQQVDADATVQFPPPVMPPPEASLSPPPPPPPPSETPPPQAQAPDGTQPTAPLPGRARGFAPQPTASGLTPPLSDTTVREWPPGTLSGGGDPDWLTERLARDVAVHDRTAWNGRWKTRLLSWGAASVLLALVAGGGFWLYEQSRVEGALVVVANTNPAPEAPASNADKSAAILAPVSALPPATLPAARPVAPDAPNPGTGPGTGTGLGAAGGSVGPSTASGAGVIDTSPLSVTDRTVKPVALGDEPAPPPKRQRSRERKQARPQQEAKARIPDAEPSARQRREETLLQCRAHGYDERQCIQRGCEMTRYGFACKG